MRSKEFARQFKSWKTVFYFFFPWFLYVAFVGIAYYLLPPKLNVGFITITFLYLIPPAGKESMVPAGVLLLKSYYGIWSVPITALSIAFVDSFVGLWMMWNWDLIKMIPFLGTYIIKLEKIGKEKWEKHQYISKLAYTGLALFVAFPFQGSGGVGATVIGRVLGMHPHKVLYAIIFGSLFGTFLIGFTTYLAVFSFQSMPALFFVVVGIIIFVAVFILAAHWLRGEKNENNGDGRSRVHREPHSGPTDEGGQ